MFELLMLTVVFIFVPTPTHRACAAVYPRYEDQPTAKGRLDACNKLAWAAEQRKFDPSLVVELAWGESRFITTSVNDVSGCSGILQAHPSYWCPEGRLEGCDLQAAGLDALAYYLKVHDDELRALCHFKSGNICTREAEKGAHRTLRRANRLREQLKGGGLDYARLAF